MDRAVTAIGDVLDEYRGVSPVMRDVSLRVVQQVLDGGRFR